MKLAGILLIFVGAIALIYGGMSFTTHKKAVDLGPVQIDKTEHHSIPMSPVLGVVALVCGGALFLLGAKSNR